MFIARFFSFLFHPLIMPIVGLVIILNSGVYSADLPSTYTRFLYITVFLCNVILPISIIPGLIYTKQLQNIYIERKQERLIPLIFTALCFIGGYYLISRFSHSALLNKYMFSGVVIAVAILIISYFWMISIHMAGIGGITGLILFLSAIYQVDMVFILCAAILIGGTIASSRLALGTHNIGQIVAGYFLGIISVYALLY